MNVTLVMMLLLACALFATDVRAKPHGHAGALPPGLAMNKERGKPLPPGWQKKLARGQRLDDNVFAEGRVISPVNAEGRMTIKVGNTTITLVAKTREILSFDL